VTESLPETLDDGLIAPTIDNDEEIPPDAPEPDGLIPVELTEEEQQNFENILTFGKKTALDEVFGHSVYLSTLTVEEELQVGLLVKPYLNTDAYYRAYKTAVVAASVKEIDGQPLYQPMSAHEDSNSIMRKKWDKVKTYYPVIVDSMYNCVTKLEEELGGLIEKISRKTSG
jgi:hypothetical protein